MALKTHGHGSHGAQLYKTVHVPWFSSPHGKSNIKVHWNKKETTSAHIVNSSVNPIRIQKASYTFIYCIWDSFEEKKMCPESGLAFYSLSPSLSLLKNLKRKPLHDSRLMGILSEGFVREWSALSGIAIPHECWDNEGAFLGNCIGISSTWSRWLDSNDVLQYEHSWQDGENSTQTKHSTNRPYRCCIYI